MVAFESRPPGSSLNSCVTDRPPSRAIPPIGPFEKSLITAYREEARCQAPGSAIIGREDRRTIKVKNPDDAPAATRLIDGSHGSQIPHQTPVAALPAKA